MTWGAVAGAAASVVGGAISGGGASDAAGIQGQASADAIAEQRRQYDQTRADNLPFLNNGTAANNRLAYLLGLGGTAGTGAQLTRDQIRQELLGQYTTRGASNVSAPRRNNMSDSWDALEYSINDNGSLNFGDQHDNDTAPNYFRSGNADIIDEAGLNAAIERRLAEQAAGQAAPNDPAYGSLLRKFGQSDLDSDLVYQNGLQFGLNEGVKGINRQAAATGSSLSGATLKALTRFGNDYGTTKTEGAYNRFNTDNTNIYNRLAGLSGTGQTASNLVSSAGTNMANNVSSSIEGAGNARAASAISGANSLGGGLTGAYSNYQQSNLLSSLLKPRSYGGYNIGSEPYAGYYSEVGL